jgi:hypothetical protein
MKATGEIDDLAVSETGNSVSVVKPPVKEAKEAKSVRAIFQLLPVEQHPEWDEFVVGCTRGSAFQTTWWYRAWGLEPVVQVLRDEAGALTAGICYATGRRFGTSAMIRPPCTAGNGPVFIPTQTEGNYKELTQAKQMALLAIHSLPPLGFYDLRLRPADTDVMPYLWNGFDTHIGYTYVIPVSHKDNWMEQASKTTRKEMRRATREVTEQGFRIEENPGAADMLPLIQDTIKAKKFEVEKLAERFDEWWQAIRKHNVGCGFLLRDRAGVPMAADILIWDRHTAYSILGGIRTDLRKDSRVGTILLERMIREAHGRGLDFDFEGSALPGVERFMRSFGGLLRPMARVVKIRSPLAYGIWQTHRYFARHRASWVWVD